MTAPEDSMQKHEKRCIVKDNRKHLIKYCPLLGGSLKAPRCDSLSLLSNSPLGLLGTRQGLTTLLLPFNLINLIQYFRIPYIHYFSTVNTSSFTSHVGTVCHFFHFQILGSLTTTIYRC